MGPVADLAGVVNVFWIVYAATQYLAFSDLSPELTIIALHFLVLPHRFVTLGLVFLDREQFGRRPRTFVGLAVFFVALVVLAGGLAKGVVGVNSFVCLAAIDYVWNAYHFSAQHYGMTRIYGKKGGGVDRPRLERWVLVGGITYTLLRLSHWALGMGGVIAVLPVVDGVVAAAFLLLIALEVRQGVPSLPKLLYLCSVSLLYVGILGAMHFLSTRVLAAAVAATGIFHSMEYLSIVTFYLKSKSSSGTWGARWLVSAAGRWAIVLPAYMTFLGVGTAWLNRIDPYWYVLLVTPMSFLHYAYDGIIWKLRKPQVASALQVGGGP